MAILEDILIELRQTKAEVLKLSSRINEIDTPQKGGNHVSRKKAAEICNVTPLTIANWERYGLVKGYRIGGRVLYKEEELKKAIEGKLK